MTHVNSNRINIYLDDETLNLINGYVKEKLGGGRSRSTVIKLAIRDYLKNWKPRKAINVTGN